MIPQVIHYCWFGGQPKPALAKKCFASWKKYCPHYEIREWNEDSYDLSQAPLYVRQAYEVKKWAFVTDYVRLQVVYEHGGIYLDTDVELLRRPDELLNNRAFFGFEDTDHINTGLGFGAEAGADILRELMDDYREIPFLLKDGGMDLTPCPVRNTRVFLRRGLRPDNTKQLLDGGALILPTEYLCPISYNTGQKCVTGNTCSIHHFSASWQSGKERRHQEYKQRKSRIERKYGARAGQIYESFYYSKKENGGPGVYSYFRELLRRRLKGNRGQHS